MTTAREIMTPNPGYVIEGHTLVGIVAPADVARSIKDLQVGELVEALSVDR